MQDVRTTVPSLAGPEFPVLDLPAFEHAAAFLDPDDVRSHMRMLIVRSEALLRKIQDQSPAAAGMGDLAASAHALGGSAGLFSFQRLAFAARDYERAAKTASPEIAAVGAALIAAIETAVSEMQNRA